MVNSKINKETIRLKTHPTWYSIEASRKKLFDTFFVHTKTCVFWIVTKCYLCSSNKHEIQSRNAPKKFVEKLNS